ncbi:armadillo-type protein [Multifurca ochricompacta]|uniref:Armadillo-type protein n=1 Tax=Multifurca ochricompacta TaxID=376703 RepID=A0AAD4M4L3_9AGAM|nr:armadillo-type protein [Multifurca ochricompacta]
MDLQSLTQLFSTTYDSNPNTRKAGELAVRKLAGQEGVIPSLLQIIASHNVEIATRQAVSVWIKNRVASSYGAEPARAGPDYKPISPADRVSLKNSILPLLATSPSRVITVQLASTLKTLISHDFPERWPELLGGAKALLASSNIRDVGAGTVVVLEMVRAFRFRQKSEILTGIVEETFGTLVTLATNLLNSPPPGVEQEIPAILHFILKSYKHSIVLNLSRYQQSAESLVPWGRLLFQVVNLRIPDDAVPADEEERERSEWWKAKKWACGILAGSNCLSRFGNPSQLPSPLQEEYGAFAQHFVTAFAPEIFKVYLHQIELYVSGQAWLSNKCQYQILQFFTEWFARIMAFRPNRLYSHIYWYFPINEYENYSSPVAAATTFLCQLVSSRTKATFLPILGFVNSILDAHPAAPQRFGALNMLSALAPFAMRHPDVKRKMEDFTLQHVLPEFTAPEGYMRAVANEVVAAEVRNHISWTGDEKLSKVFRAVVAGLDDPELPVRVHAALTLTEMVSSHESVKAAVSPQVGKVIQDLLKLSDETDLDILNSSMETMVEHFQDELLPVAAQLTARLCESYMRLVREAIANEENAPKGDDLETLMDAESDDDKTYAAMGVAKTLSTIVSSIDSSPEILAQVQEVIIPIIRHTLEKKVLDLFDNMYELVDSLTFKSRSISPNMWPVFELTYELFRSDAIDFLDEMLPSLDNFVSYGTDVFRARTDYRQKALDIYITALSSDHLGENDRVNGCKLAESLLLNLRGHIDDQLPQIIATAFSHLDKAETKAFELANLEVLINTVLYNPGVALALMEAQRPNGARIFFDRWFVAVNAERGLPRVHDKTLSIVALSALLEMEPSAVPAELREGWPGIVGGAIRVFKGLPKAVTAARKALQESLHDDEDEDDEDEQRYLNLNEEEGDVWDEDSAYIEMLAKEGQRLREAAERREHDPDGGASDVSDEEEIEEELGFISPLDAVNPYVTFKQALTALEVKDRVMYQASTTALNVEQQTLLMEIMRIAEEVAVVGRTTVAGVP